MMYPMLAQCFLTVCSPPTSSGRGRRSNGEDDRICGVTNKSLRIFNTACGRRSSVGCRSDVIAGRRRVPKYKYARPTICTSALHVRTSSSTRLRWTTTVFLSLRASSMKQIFKFITTSPDTWVPILQSMHFFTPVYRVISAYDRIVQVQFSLSHLGLHEILRLWAVYFVVFV